MPELRKVIISGSNARLNSLFVTGTVSGSILSGSHVGDGSGLTGIASASYALSASYAPGSPAVSSSYAVSASFASTASYFQEIKTFGITIDGGGSAISTGIKGDITIPFSCYIDSWYLTADQAGSIVIDVWRDTLANFPPTVVDTIAGSEKPTLSGVAFNSDTNLTTFTRSLSANDVLRFNVDSVATITRANLVFKALV